MSVSKDKLEQAAAALRQAYETGVACAPVRDVLGEEAGVADAYAVQEINTAHWLGEGRRLVGRKIGLTSRAVQAQLGVDQPDYGMLFADMARADGEPIALGDVMQPRIEAEVAFVLGADLVSEGLTLADVLRSVEYAVAAIEVVGSRVRDWDISIIDTIADNASSGLYVLSGMPRRLEGLDLRSAGMVVEHRGEPVSVGAGAACLGHPLNAVLWLARTMVAVGRPLKAGDTVLSGALGPLVPITGPGVYEARIAGLGSVQAEFVERT